MVRSFFNHGHMLKELNKTYITLVPENSNHVNLNHYRPISLCNISYKIILKVLPNGLKEVLPKIISPVCGAFIQDHDIHYNSLVAH